MPPLAVIPCRFGALIAGVSLAIATGCSDQGMDSSSEHDSDFLQTSEGFEWLAPWPQGNDLHSVTAAGPGHYFAVGNRGTVLESTRSGWRLHQIPEGDDLAGVWAAGPSEVYAGGLGGRVFRYDGSRWTRVSGLEGHDIFAMDGSSGSDIWVLTFEGAAIHWDGIQWTASEGIVRYGDYELGAGLWVHSTTLAYAVGRAGDQDDSVLLRWDGARWETALAEPGSYFKDVWGSEPEDVHAIRYRLVAEGDSRIEVLHFDGEAWSISYSAPKRDHFLSARIDGSGRDNVWVAQGLGELIHWDGAQWSTNDFSAVRLPAGLAVAADGDALIAGAGGTVQRLESSTWRTESFSTKFTNVSVARFGSGVAFLGTLGGGYLIGLGTVPSVFSYALVEESRPSLEIVPDVGRALGEARDAWSPDGNTVFVVGRGITSLSEGVWRTEELDRPGRLNSVHGSGATDAWAVGDTGLALHFDGATWGQIETGTQESILDVWSGGPTNAYLVSSVEIRHFDGVAWSPLPVPQEADDGLTTIWGEDSDEVYFGGAGGRVLLLSDGILSPMATGTMEDIEQIRGNGRGDVYAVSQRPFINASLMHLRAGGWTTTPLPRQDELPISWSLYVDAEGDAYLGGVSSTSYTFSLHAFRYPK